jgi:uncharacterized OsmC-like protein
MTITSEREEIIRKGIQGRASVNDPERIKGVTRIDIGPVDGLAFAATLPRGAGVEIIMDEPAERGGTSAGLGPLNHFLAGVGGCLYSQFAKVTIADNLDVRFTGMNVRGDYRRDVGGGFEHIMQEVHAEGSLSKGDLERLTERAEGFCYIHNTLSKAIKMTTVVYLNGEEAVRRVSNPS